MSWPGGKILLYTASKRSWTSGDEAIVAQTLATGARTVLVRDAADARLELADAENERERGDAGDTVTPGAGRGGSRWSNVAALSSMGAALGAGVTWSRGSAPEPRELRFVVTPPAPSGEIGFVRISRDGRRLVYQLSSEPRLLLHELDSFDSRRIPGTEGARNPFLSADGRSVGFYQGGKIRTLSL